MKTIFNILIIIAFFATAIIGLTTCDAKMLLAAGLIIVGRILLYLATRFIANIIIKRKTKADKKYIEDFLAKQTKEDKELLLKFRLKKLTIGGTTLEKLLKNFHYYISDGALKMLRGKDFTISPDKKSMVVAIISPENFEFNDSNGKGDWLEFIKNHRLFKILPAEAGPQFRMQYSQPRYEFLIVAMEPIPGDKERPSLFHIVHGQPDLDEYLGDFNWMPNIGIWGDSRWLVGVKG